MFSRNSSRDQQDMPKKKNGFVSGDASDAGCQMWTPTFHAAAVRHVDFVHKPHEEKILVSPVGAAAC